jgi:hypothetical protein
LENLKNKEKVIIVILRDKGNTEKRKSLLLYRIIQTNLVTSNSTREAGTMTTGN